MFLLITILFMLSGFGCDKGDVESGKPVAKSQPTNSPTAAPTTAPLTAPSAAPTSTRPKDGDYPGKGKVTKINNDLGSVELDHEEIVGVMPRMIMEFYVSDKTILKGLAVGDQVDFVLRHKGSTETIVKITKAK
ncbi:MAG: copper-binding protein [Pyrinomonadaceae bacterium]